MNSRHIFHASLAAVLPLLSLQACAVDAVDDEEVDDVSIEIVVEDPDCVLEDLITCEQTLDPSVEGVTTCIEDEDGLRGWGTCVPRTMEGPDDCFQGELWDGDRCSAGSTVSTPIVLRFGADEVRYTRGGGDFDLTGKGMSVATDWPTAATPWLALDRDGNGRIEDGSELFGSGTRLSSGQLAHHGFEALAELDQNGDGAINAADAAFTSLRVWADDNGDRTSQPHELKTLAELGITSLSVQHRVEQTCDARGNCGRERAAFTFVVDGVVRHGEAVDVYLPWR